MTTDSTKTVYDQIDAYADQLDGVLAQFGRNLRDRKPFFSEQDSAELADENLEAAAKHAAGVILLGFVQVGKFDPNVQQRLVIAGMAAADGLNDEDTKEAYQKLVMLELMGDLLSVFGDKEA